MPNGTNAIRSVLFHGTLSKWITIVQRVSESALVDESALLTIGARPLACSPTAPLHASDVFTSVTVTDGVVRRG